MELWSVVLQLHVILLFLTMLRIGKTSDLFVFFLTEIDAQLECRHLKILQPPGVYGLGIVTRPGYTPRMGVLQLWHFVLAGNFVALLLLA